jgi:hypothetical protein
LSGEILDRSTPKGGFGRNLAVTRVYTRSTVPILPLTVGSHVESGKRAITIIIGVEGLGKETIETIL